MFLNKLWMFLRSAARSNFRSHGPTWHVVVLSETCFFLKNAVYCFYKSTISHSAKVYMS